MGLCHVRSDESAAVPLVKHSIRHFSIIRVRQESQRESQSAVISSPASVVADGWLRRPEASSGAPHMMTWYRLSEDS